MIWLNLAAIIWGTILLTLILLNVVAMREGMRNVELPEMFTQQLNRRLIEEHTRELKKFNATTERKH